MKLSRRSFLLASATALGAGGYFAARSFPGAAPGGSRPLFIPPLIDARETGQFVELNAQAGRTRFFAGRESETLGYNASYLGPTVRLHRGDDVQFAVRNSLPESTTVHWHGLLVPGELDGSPHQLIEPGDTWRPVLPVRGSNARIYDLSFADRRAFHWIASEGGLLREPVELRSLPLAPGQRAEIVVDFADGEATSLVTGDDPNTMGRARRIADTVAGAFSLGNRTVLAFEPDGRIATTSGIPARLSSYESFDAARSVRRRRFLLGMGMGAMMGGGMMGGGMNRGGMGMQTTINGRPFDMSRIDERVRLGESEIWEVSGEMMAHPFHVHGVHFEVLSRAGGKPHVLDQGLRDTVVVQEPVELLVHFTQPAVKAPFMYHCHILEHEDSGMMGQYLTT